MASEPASEPDFLTATRAAYDAAADTYTATVPQTLDALALPLAMFAAFAELVRANGNVVTADVGCGPGDITARLNALGLDAFGIDLSPAMVAAARREHPELRFETGSMLALDLPDADPEAGTGLGGLVAYYSIIHVPWERRADVFAEFHRVLAPGGYVLLGFQIGAERRHNPRAYGHDAPLTSYRQRPADIAELLTEAGFAMVANVESEPDPTGGPEAPGHGHVLARRPATT